MSGGSAGAQIFVAGLGGAAALSNAAAAVPSPPSASNYDAGLGAAANGIIGYHWNDWVSVQGRYIWNRNHIVTSAVLGGAFQQTSGNAAQNTFAGEVLVYFRPRQSKIRPYLSAGPAWVHFQPLSLPPQNHLGWPVAVGVDLQLRRGWGLRYSFSETMSVNPFARALNPPAGGMLMNAQNLAGFVKIF